MTEADVIFFGFTHLNAPIGALKGLVRLSYCIKLVYWVYQKVYRRSRDLTNNLNRNDCGVRS